MCPDDSINMPPLQGLFLFIETPSGAKEVGEARLYTPIAPLGLK